MSVAICGNQPTSLPGSAGIGMAALAINDAIGAIIYELPITPERVFRTIREKKNGGGGH